MTSAIMKAVPAINMSVTSINLSLSPPVQVPVPVVNNGTNTSIPATIPPPQPGALINPEIFWQAISLIFMHGIGVIDAGGTNYGYVYNNGNGSYSFTNRATFPNMTPNATLALLEPLYASLSNIGAGIELPDLSMMVQYASGKRDGAGDDLVNTRYRSQLLPRNNWKTAAVFNKTMVAIRKGVEAGYTFHHMMYGATEAVAGWPGADSGVNPAWREAAMHAMFMEVQPVGISAQEARDRDARIKQYTDLWRELTPTPGAYLNEGDPTEPNWQQAFFGNKYQKLLDIKQKRDPWGLFWAQTTVGSEVWEVITSDGYPGSQNGKLCRAKGAGM
jgi:hypothetical protein